ncbi:putative glyoxalase superfamily protein PhnB [Kribbella kalugense]|uniref:Putative glyoxalase superfamily protein PhnB n=2 Tax=Kribbella kalugense TaxID=2512221 RepID=A0A4R7ZXD2_9ACTN|nr:putative glyoxalase superfamily protein PhnB [Kribbella kalugense]
MHQGGAVCVGSADELRSQNLVHTEQPSFKLVRMTPIAQLQVNLFCDDVEACLAFYQRFGLTEAFRAPATGPIQHVEVEAAGTRIGLTSARVANDLVGLGVAPTTTPSTELVFWCDDVDALYDHALSSGATSVVPPTNSPDNRLRFAWLHDPESHQLKLVQNA